MTATRQVQRAAGRLFKACVVDARLDQAKARRVAREIARRGHRRGLAILSHFARLVRLDLDRHTAAIESATPLPGDLRADIERELERIYGPSLESSFVLDPSLIGGMRIRVGSDVYDGSVRGRLAALAARM